MLKLILIGLLSLSLFSSDKVIYECYAHDKDLKFDCVGISDNFEEAKRIAVEDCYEPVWVQYCNKYKDNNGTIGEQIK